MAEKKNRAKETGACGLKPDMRGRPLMNREKAVELEALFKVLANQTRLRMLHALVLQGRMCVTDLAEKIEMRPQATSNQLQRMAASGIVSAERNGGRIFYRIADPCVTELLDRGLCLREDAGKRKKKVPK